MTIYTKLFTPSNPQVTVDKGGIILANDVCQDATDYAQLQPQVLETIDNIGELPKETAWNFDAGYYEGENLNFLEKNNIDAYIPDHNDKKGANPYDKRNFIFDRANNEYICPENKRLIYTGTHFEKQKQKDISLYKGQACLECPVRRKCTKSKTGIRLLKRVEFEDERNSMVAKMKTSQAKEIYRLRARTVEPTIGDIKENKGVRSFLTRGITTVRSEFNLVCTGVNLKRIWLAAKLKNKPIRTIETAFASALSPLAY
jgi:transposase